VCMLMNLCKGRFVVTFSQCISLCDSSDLLMKRWYRDKRFQSPDIRNWTDTTHTLVKWNENHPSRSGNSSLPEMSTCRL
jgi:hypothetical protein